MKLYHHSQGAGRPLIILHGLFGSSDNWRGIAKQLATATQVIRVDLPNHGQSPHSDDISYDLMADDVIELMADLNLQQADVIGHSIGGKVAMMLAARYPEKVGRLVVVDMAPKAYPDRHSDIFEALLALDLSQFSKRNDVDAALANTIADKAIRQFLLMNLALTDGKLRWRINLQGLSDHYSQLLQPVCEGQRIEQPALFLRGGLSNYIEQGDEVMIKQTFRNSDITIVEQAGHWIHAERPDLFLSHVKRFFDYD
jgi:pimeloyl-ACP methyl ester carboxylesterase